MATPFASAAKNAMTFEHAMSRVKALTQSAHIREGQAALVEREMKALTAQAKQLGATTMFTSTQAAGADLAQTADIVSDNFWRMLCLR